MNGALKNASSRIAIAAVVGLVWSASSASAADLGGNCCADLEERVAELEATAARKGNRKMSLTVSGQVTRAILYYNDHGAYNGSAGAIPGASSSGTYAGLDNHNQSTRFIFSGTARINPSITAGFEFMTEIGLGGRTSSADQLSPDGNGAGFLANDEGLAVRTANWWLEDKTLGRVTVGRINNGGPVGTIDLGGISTVAHYSPGLDGGGFFVAGSATRLASVIGPTYGGDRMEGIRYDSPSIGGFLFQAAWGEDDIWDASVRYAADISGFRIAAGIGYQKQDGTITQPIQLDTGARNIDNEWSGSLALMHVASGLFVQGEYAKSEFLNNTDARFWMIQGGVSKNWFGLGNTSLYGEYGRASDFIKAGAAASGTPSTTPALVPGNLVGFPDANSEVKFYGLGIVQQLDAAAMEVYLGWRRFSTDVTQPISLTPLPANSTGSSDIDIVTGGARIRF